MRTHHLIERGAIFESLIPNAKDLTNEQVKHLLKTVLQTKSAACFLEEIAKENAAASLPNCVSM